MWGEYPQSAGGGAALQTAVKVAPGGTAVWGAVVTAGTASLSAPSLRVSGLPAGATVGPINGPLFKNGLDEVKVSSCTPSGADYVCSLSQDIPTGKAVEVPLAIKAGSAQGASTVIVAVQESGATVATTAFTLSVAKKVKDAIMVRTDGERAVHETEKSSLTYYVYNLGGAKKKARAGLTLTNVLPAKLRKGSSVKGAGWSCAGASSCTLNGKLAVGGNAKQLVGKFKVPSKVRKGLPSSGDNKQLGWTIKVTGKGFTGAHRAELAILPKSKKQAELVTSKDKRKASLVLHTRKIGTPRRGGNGGFYIAVNNGGGKKAIKPTVKLNFPAHLTIARFQSKQGWKCDRAAATCVLKAKTLAPHTGAPPIEVVLRSAAKNNRIHHRASVVASWRFKGKSHSVKRSLNAKWDPLLKLSSKPVWKRISSGGSGGLKARIHGLSMSKYHWKFRQVSGPKVRWKVAQKGGPGSDPELNGAFVAPKVKKKQVLTFETVVHVGEVVLRKRTSVIVRPANFKIDPRVKTSQPPHDLARNAGQASASQLRDKVVRSRSVKRMKPVAVARIKGGKQAKIQPGKWVTLDLRLSKIKKGAKVKKVVWRSEGAPKQLLKKTKRFKSGQRIKVKVPRQVPTNVVMSAVVKFNKGRSLSISKILSVPPAKLQLAGLGKSVSASAAGFCDMYTAAQSASLNSVQVGSATLTLGTLNVTGSSCSDTNAAIGFSGGSMTINSTNLSSLAGSITSSGLTITSGVLNLPTGSGVGPNLVAIPFNTSATGQFGGNGFTGLTATFNLTAMPYLPLPASWRLTQGTLTVTWNGTSYALALAANASDSASADSSVAVQGAINSDGSFNFGVAVANIWTLTGSDGSTAAFSGTGSISAPAGGPVSYSVVATLAGGNSKPFTIYGGVQLSQALVTWDQNGAVISTNMSLAMNETTYSVAATGTISGYNNWMLTVTKSNLAINFRSLTITDFHGSLVMTPAAAASGDLSMDVKADVSFVPGVPQLIKLNIQVTSAQFHLGIFCNGQLTPFEQSACKNQELQGQIDIQGTIGSADLDTTADVNLTTGGFMLETTIGTEGGFGPVELAMTNVEFFYSNDPDTEPKLQGNPCMTDKAIISDQFLLGFTATAQLADIGSINVTGVYIQSGDAENDYAYCMASDAVISGSSLNGSSTPNGWKFSDGLAFVYTSYQTQLMVDGVAQEIQASQATLLGVISAPRVLQQLTDSNFPGVSVVVSWQSKTNYKVEGDLLFPDGPYLIGNSSSKTSVQFQKAGVDLAVNNGHVAYGLNVQMNLHTTGSPTGTNPGQAVDGADVPIYGSIMYSPAGEELNLAFEMGFLADGGNCVVSSPSCGTPQNYQNAFGVAGMTLNALAVTATISAEDSGFGVAASIETPGDTSTSFGKIMHAIGIQPFVDISLAVQISEESPCFAVAITPGVGHSDTSSVIDWGGVITANMVEFSMAPQGCTVATKAFPAGAGVSEGYEFVFDGALLNDEVQIEIVFQLAKRNDDGTWATPQGEDVSKYCNAKQNLSGPGACGWASLDVGAFNLAGVNVNETKFFYLFDTYSMQMQFQFSGGINVWGISEIEASGSFSVTLGTIKEEIAMTFNGQSETDLMGIFKSGMGFSFDIDFVAPLLKPSYFKTFDIAANANIKVLIIDASASVAFDYGQQPDGTGQIGVIDTMYADFSLSVDLWIVAAGARATLNYNRAQDVGKLSIEISGYVKFWAFGWHTVKATILNTHITFDFKNGQETPPPPANYTDPAPPVSQWPSVQYGYTTNMFLGIPWDSGQLGTAAALPTGASPECAVPGPSQCLSYGVATDPSSIPQAKFVSNGVTIGNTTAPSDTNAQIAITVTLPQTPTYAQVASWGPARNNPNFKEQSSCSGNSTQNLTVNIPQWNGNVPNDSTNAAIVLAEVNWRMYLASVIETTSIAGVKGASPADKAANYTCGYDNWDSFPTLSDWLANNNLGTQLNIGYPQPHPNDDTQLCQAGLVPGSAYAQACAQNLASLGQPWGAGWGVQGPPMPPLNPSDAPTPSTSSS